MNDNNKTDPVLMEVADKVFWDEFNQTEKAADRYIVIDSKNNKVISQNIKLITDRKKIKV